MTLTLTDTDTTSSGTSSGTSLTGTSSSTMMGGKRRRHKAGCKCLKCKKRRTMKSRKHGGKRTRRHRRK